jgi:flavin-dependent dehydrogenase
MGKIPGIERVAIVGAGIAGLTSANLLREHLDVEIFESCEKNCESRPFQMEGGLNFLDNVPDLKETYPIEYLIFASENEHAEFRGNIGYVYKIGGIDGIDAKLRKSIEKRVKINYATRITSIDTLRDFDAIIIADGFRSLLAQNAGFREKNPTCVGWGLGSTVEGDFEMGKVFSLFDNNYAPGGYLYLIPISPKKASLVSASIESNFQAKKIREKLREYANDNDLRILNEWVDMEKWFTFHTYQKNNIFVIGGAASFTDKAFGFGLKLSIQSAKLSVKAILEKKDYNALLRPQLRELNIWDRMARVLVTADNRVRDNFVRLTNMPLTRKRIESGKSMLPFHRPFLFYCKSDNPPWWMIRRHKHGNNSESRPDIRDIAKSEM